MAALQALLLWGALTCLLAAPSPTRPGSASAAPTGVEVRVGVVLPERNPLYPWARPRVAPALSLALEALEPELRHAGLAVRVAFASTKVEDYACSSELAFFEATVLRKSHDPDVLLGLGCSPQVSDHVAQLAEHWQLPLLRAGAPQISRELGNTTVYAGPEGLQDHAAFKDRLLQHFNWTCLPLVVASPAIESRYYGSWQDFPIHYYKEPGEAVRFIQANGRVVFICGFLKMLQDIMRLAHAQNMTNGDYVFIYVDVFGESLEAEWHREAAKPWQGEESPDVESLQEAFQTVLVITTHELRTPTFRRFKRELILRTQREFGVAVNDSLGTLVAGCFHDGLLLYLRALNETLREGGTKRDTSRILEKMRGLKIQGVTGRVRLNNDSDREVDFDLWAMKDVESGKYQVVAHFVESENRINWTGTIHWKKGAPPLNNPPCAFDLDDSSFGGARHSGGGEPLWRLWSSCY